MKAVALALFACAGCRHEPTEEEIKGRYQLLNDRDDVEIARKEVEDAQMNQQIARQTGKTVDPVPLMKAQAHLQSAELMLHMDEDR